MISNFHGLHWQSMTHKFLLLLIFLYSRPATGQIDFERPPVSYSESQPIDRVFALSEALSSGTATLRWTKEHGYLESVLEALRVPVSSQTLVFSKTSLQVGRISPRTPRALYFNDDVYVGWVQGGDLIELSAADPRLGGTFYVLPQKPSDQPRIRRETGRCLQCHGSTHTRRVPGHIIRSVYPDARGMPVFRLGTSITDNRTPFTERWGGWYVTGSHGELRHRGNSVLSDPDSSEELNQDVRANVMDLSPIVNVRPYLSSHSDIVALMVLQHQVHMHNVLTAASHSGQLTMRDAAVMNRMLERSPDFESESTARRYQSAAEKVVKALLFCDEFRLTSPVRGTSSFQSDFARQGPHDAAGRSLRDFDLRTRLFRYPCSFLIYSEPYQALPDGVRSRVERRLEDILIGEDASPDFAHLTPDDRRAIHDILTATR